MDHSHLVGLNDHRLTSKVLDMSGKYGLLGTVFPNIIKFYFVDNLWGFMGTVKSLSVVWVSLGRSRFICDLLLLVVAEATCDTWWGV